MQVKLISNTNLSNTVIAARTCYNSFSKTKGNYKTPTDDITEDDKDLLNRLLFKNKHESVFEHLVYTFKIEGIPRYTLQELARHRIASYSVKSTRYCTSKELRSEKPFESEVEENSVSFDDETLRRAGKYIYITENEAVNALNILQLEMLRTAIENGITSDIVKPLIPESFKTDLVWTINLRSLRNFIKLRLHKSAHSEIRKLANLIFDNIPQAHKFLFEDLNDNV